MIIPVCLAYLWICTNITNDNNEIELPDIICMVCMLIGVVVLSAFVFVRPELIKTACAMFTSIVGILITSERKSNVGITLNTIMLILSVISMFQC